MDLVLIRFIVIFVYKAYSNLVEAKCSDMKGKGPKFPSHMRLARLEVVSLRA